MNSATNDKLKLKTNVLLSISLQDQGGVILLSVWKLQSGMKLKIYLTKQRGQITPHKVIKVLGKVSKI